MRIVSHYCLQLPAVINSAIGIYLLDFSISQAFNIFIIASFVGILMYITLHITYNILPKIFKKQKGGMYVCVCAIFFTLIPMPLACQQIF